MRASELQESQPPKKTIVVSRTFLLWRASGGWLGGHGGLLAVPVLRYIFYPLYAKSARTCGHRLARWISFPICRSRF